MRMIVLSLLLMLSSEVAATAGQCEQLASLEISHAKVISTHSTESSCQATVRVWPEAVSKSQNSFIEVSVWLPPAANWNGRLLGLGNGGYSPALPQDQMAKYLAQGFVVAASDTGHKTESLDFVVEAQERIDYWGRLSVQVLGQYSKLLIQKYYQRPQHHSYFAGCSTGGHQALTAAQYFPAEYDGILAGAPGNNRVALNAAFLWLFQQSHQRLTGKQLLTRQDLKLVQQQVFSQCDLLDGKKDLVLDNPSQCAVDFTAVTCSDQSAEHCLSSEKIERIKNIYAGPQDPVTKQAIYPGFLPGTEFIDQYGWSSYWHDAKSATQPARADFWRYWAFQDPSWDPWQFDWHKDMEKAQQLLSPRIDALKTDLSPFVSQGHKLLLFHGLADPVVSASDTINYTAAVFDHTKIKEGSLNDSIQLYLIPGMAHCAGGNGINQVDFIPALLDWVEKGITPEHIMGSRIKNHKTIYQRRITPQLNH